MPTISPSIRPQIGGSNEPAPHRVSISANTGMNIPPRAPIAEQNGQPNISKEDTTQPAVTLSPQLTALARKQQKLQSEIQALREKEAAFAAKEADYVPKSALKAKMQANAQEALKDLGYSYEEITELLLSQQNGADPVKALQAEINQLKQNQETQTNKQYEATLKQYKAEAESLIASDPKAYHFINKEKRADVVVQHIVDTWKEDESKVLTVEQAAREVETVLREEAKKAADLLRELEPASEVTQPKEKTLPPPKTAARTLTNQIESTPTRSYNQFQHMSMKERIATAIARVSK